MRKSPPAHRQDRVVQRAVAGVGRHVREREIAAAQRGKDAGQHDVGAESLRRLARAPDELRHLALHLGETAALERPRRDVRFEVEEGELRREPGLARALEHPQGERRGPALAVDQEHLLLGADAARGPVEATARLEHVLERANVRQQGLHERAALVLVPQRGGVLLAHLHETWAPCGAPKGRGASGVFARIRSAVPELISPR